MLTASFMLNPISSRQGKLNTWLIDSAGNVAISPSGVALLGRIEALIIPFFTSTEQAVEWGSHLNDEQHATLVDIQRTASNATLSEPNPQRMVDLATQLQLMREAAEAVPESKRK